jgi:uncharacterized protein
VIEFDWDQDNISHIAKHGVSQADAEYALNGETIVVDFLDWHGEERFCEIGSTASGKILTLWTTPRGRRLRVVTAYDAPKHLVVEYRKTR